MEEAFAQEKKIWIVLFNLVEETWGIKFADIQEILEPKEITPVPKTPPFIIGIAPKRGMILTILDLALFVGEVRQEGTGSKIIQIKSGKIDFGFLIRSKISAELIPQEGETKGLVVKEFSGGKKVIMGKRMIFNNNHINILEPDHIVGFLEEYPFAECKIFPST